MNTEQTMDIFCKLTQVIVTVVAYFQGWYTGQITKCNVYFQHIKKLIHRMSFQCMNLITQI